MHIKYFCQTKLRGYMRQTREHNIVRYKNKLLNCNRYEDGNIIEILEVEL